MNELETFKEIIPLLKKKGSIDNEIEQILIKVFSKERYLRSFEKIELKLIKCYNFEPSNRRIWVVKGEESNYLIYPLRYCSCIDFYLNWILKKKTFFCKHLLAQSIIENLGSFNINDYLIKVLDEDYKKIMKDFIVYTILR